jgi:hypothetical protein
LRARLARATAEARANKDELLALQDKMTGGMLETSRRQEWVLSFIFLPMCLMTKACIHGHVRPLTTQFM